MKAVDFHSWLVLATEKDIESLLCLSFSSGVMSFEFCFEIALLDLPDFELLLASEVLGGKEALITTLGSVLRFLAAVCWNAGTDRSWPPCNLKDLLEDLSTVFF